jgi:LPS export ABC transporter protein LptC
MTRLRVLATIFVVAVAALAIWVAGTGVRTGRTGDASRDTAGSAYDYEVRDVVVQQMAPDGTLQYEIAAKQITQEPKNGRISAQDLVMHRDPAGSEAGGPHRWTLRAQRADLPESGALITLQGNVRAEGRPQDSQSTVAVATESLTYSLETQDVTASTPVDVVWGGSRFHAKSMQLNIRSGDIKTGAINVDSSDGVNAPK